MRNGQQEADGVVGEVIFPNTIPPFFPSFVLFAAPPKPEDYEHRLAGIRAHNRWLVDFCGEFPERRAGIGQIFLNDIDDAIADVHWIKEHGLRGGILLPNVPPDVKWVRPLYDPAYDRLWEVIQDLEMPINVHGGTGAPDYGDYPFAMLFYINEVGLLLAAALRPLRPGRGLRALPTPEVRHHRDPVLLGAQTAQGSRRHHRPDPQDGPDRRDPLRGRAQARPPGQRVLRPERVDGSEPAPARRRGGAGPDRCSTGSCGAATTPTTRGPTPSPARRLRQVLPGIGPDEKQKILGENCAKLYDFDLAKLAPLAAKFGPTVEELDEPLDRLPENPNDALLKSVVPSG